MKPIHQSSTSQRVVGGATSSLGVSLAAIQHQNSLMDAELLKDEQHDYYSPESAAERSEEAEEDEESI